MQAQQSRQVPLVRGALLWIVLAGCEGVLGSAMWPSVHSLPPTFASALTTFAGLVLLLVLTWAVMAMATLLLEALTGRRPAPWCCPGAMRRAALLLCGATVLGLGSPVYAAEGHHLEPGIARGDLTGLPSLDRPSGASAEPGMIVVRPGDSLWKISARRLPGASTARIARDTVLLYGANRDRIGPDPDLIRPGQRLRVPLTHRPAK